MDDKNEQRLDRRFLRHMVVEIRRHSCPGLYAVGVLVDCSQGGVGFFSPEAMKRDDVVLLRVCAASARETSRWPAEAGQFNMITAKVRWCQESRSDDGDDGFRVGGQRMLPFY